MEPFNLIREGGADVVALACGSCKRVYSTTERLWAEECCDRERREARQNAERAERDAKFAAESAQRKAKALANAIRIPYEQYQGGMVYSDELDRYFEDWESLVDAYYWDEEKPPEYAWGTTATTFCIPSAGQIVQDAIESGEWYDGIEYDVDASPELIAAVDAFNAEQTVCSYEVDYRVLVLAPGSSNVSPASMIDDAEGNQ